MSVARVIPARIVIAGSVLEPLTLGVVALLRPIVKDGERVRLAGGTYTAEDTVTGIKILLREERRDLSAGRLDIWEAIDGEELPWRHWWFGAVTWERRLGRWGGMAGLAARDATTGQIGGWGYVAAVGCTATLDG